MERILIDGLSFAIPLFVMAIGGIYSEKSGVTNLALEGLQGMGAFIGAFVAVLAAGYFGSNSQVPYYLAIVCAMAGGMLYSLLYGLLCIRLKANQIIGGVVINILAMSLTAFFTKPPCVRCSFGKICSGCVCTVYNSAALRHPSNWSRI